MSLLSNCIALFVYPELGTLTSVDDVAPTELQSFCVLKLNEETDDDGMINFNYRLLLNGQQQFAYIYNKDKILSVSGKTEPWILPIGIPIHDCCRFDFFKLSSTMTRRRFST